MRKLATFIVFSALAALTFSTFAEAQVDTGPQAELAKQHCGQTGQAGTEYQRLCASTKPSAPAPKHDIIGSWSGPIGANRGEPVPPMTAWGQERFAANGGRSNGSVPVAESNDPLNHCDPLGFPRNDTFELRGLSIGKMPNRILILYQYERIWREIWTDGRALPKNAGSDDRNAPDPRYYGYSVGHWDGDTTLVVDTTGVDDATWVDGAGHPHSTDMHVEERFMRRDQDTLQVSVKVDDPKAYTKPWTVGTTVFKWIPEQDFEEQLCIPSQADLYLQTIARPAGARK